ncbi:MAG: hypothetical protein JNL72_00510 [Flavipsychrobacter sp.]|nr:hypothetical protein [Flavipsychrobacter sp.]
MFQPELRLSRPAILRYTLLIIAVSVSFLFSPPPKNEKDYCGQYIHLGAHAGFTFNCDAADYCMNADDPGRMLGDSAVRQSRPLFVLLASAVGHPVQWLSNKLNLPLFHSMGEEASRYVGYYIGYILINFLTILLSLLLFRSLATYVTQGGINKWVLLSFQLILVSNEVTKAFFWTAHQQFFALLTPLLTLWVALRLVAQGKTLPQIGRLSLACGIGMLLYGNFLPMFGTILIVSYLTDRKLHTTHLLKNLLLFLMPTVLWVSFCIYHHGHYYNREVAAYRQLVWIKDAFDISAGRFFIALGENALSYLRSFGEMSLFAAAGIAAAAYAKKQPAGPHRATQTAVVTGAVLAGFFLLLGFYEERLTYTLLPVCLFLMLSATNTASRRQKNIAYFLLPAIVWHLYTVLSYGPFS